MYRVTAAAVICGSSAAGVTAGMTIYLTNLTNH
jgi:hypothetical protein